MVDYISTVYIRNEKEPRFENEDSQGKQLNRVLCTLFKGFSQPILKNASGQRLNANQTQRSAFNSQSKKWKSYSKFSLKEDKRLK